MMSESIELKLLTKPADMLAVVQLQQIYWGDDMQNLVPAHILLNYAQSGGHVIGAFAGETLVGAAIAYLGTAIALDDSRPAKDGLAIMSKRAVVLPDYRGSGVGEKLKRMQYALAQQQGIDLIRWTFDPVLARNAYFNLFKLGAIVQHYASDYFGEAGTHPALQADRAVANWWVDHPHSDAHLAGQVEQPLLSELQARSDVYIVDSPQTSDSSLVLIDDYAMILIPVPYDFFSIVDHVLADKWRVFLRVALTTCLDAGYIITTFVRDDRQVFYGLTPDDGTYYFSD